jgi:uncharacterized protein
MATIIDGEFEWHDKKARLNIINHHLPFEVAKLAFRDPNLLEVLDDRGYDEVRFNVTGYAQGRLIIVTYTETEAGRKHLITARKADKHEQYEYYHR